MRWWRKRRGKEAWQPRGKGVGAALVTDCWMECVGGDEFLKLRLWKSICGKSHRMGVADLNTDQRWVWHIAD